MKRGSNQTITRLCSGITKKVKPSMDLDSVMKYILYMAEKDERSHSIREVNM
jgi:hypothetical protein